jgi:hypothetical protein
MPLADGGEEGELRKPNIEHLVAWPADTPTGMGLSIQHKIKSYVLSKVNK